MNTNCIICSDLFTPSAEIYSTGCGHVFHYACLIQWIERSKSCPQCRAKATEKTIHRIYFNIATTEGQKDDAIVLQHKLDSMQFQIRLKDKDISNLTEKNDKLNNQNVGLRAEIKDLESELRVKHSALCALKEKVGYFKEKAKECEKLSDEVIRLKDKLRGIEDVQTVISGSREDANDILRHNRDPNTLCLMVSTMKKELLASDRKRKQIYQNLKQLQNDILDVRREATKYMEENEKLKNEVEVHKNCESERKYLKKKIVDLEAKLSQNKERQNCDTPNTSIRRIITESPAPLRPITLDDSCAEIDFDSNHSPSVQEKVKSTLESDSPYLPVKSCSIGLSTFGSKLSYSVNNKKFTIFKAPPPKLDSFKIPKKDYAYDGMGGHAKEEKFPSPTNTQNSLKRHKSSSSIPSSKFRKLAPNKKLNDYFNQTTET